ncbi:MAG: hypothetical protein KDC33_02235 [Thermoleophilia bacterium]|nr:hypothetical protein [Thermoleophilia bacterium]
MRPAPAAGALAVALAVHGCGGAPPPPPLGSLTLAHRGFTESRLIAEAYAQSLRDEGFAVRITDLVGDADGPTMVRLGRLDAYVDYDGSVYLTQLDNPAPTRRVPPTTLWRAVSEGLAVRGVTAMPPAPFSNSNQVACTTAATRRWGIADMPSLARAAPHLTYAANREHLTRRDGLPLLRRAYGIRFGSVVMVPVDGRYAPITDGRAQCVYAFSTDPQLATLPLALVRDDAGRFAGTVDFRPFLAVSTVALHRMRAPARAALDRAVSRVTSHLTLGHMRELNSEVDLDGRPAQDVARAFVASLQSD